MTVSGGIGGAAFWLAVYPIDSVKSRIQVLSMAGRQEGFLLSFLHIMRTEGLSYCQPALLKQGVWQGERLCLALGWQMELLPSLLLMA